MADIRSLRRSGFSDAEIAKYGRSQVAEGKTHGNPVSKFMDQHGKLDYHYGEWGKSFGGSDGSSGSGSDGSGSDGGKTPAKDPQEFADRFKYDVGSFIHKPRDYGQVATQIEQDALRASDARNLPELRALQKCGPRSAVLEGPQ